MSNNTVAESLTEQIETLCGAILKDEQVAQAQKNLNAFIDNEDARQLWQEFEACASALHQKQSKGEAFLPTETEKYEELRKQLEENSLIVNFLEARQVLGNVQKQVGQYVGLTLELGKVPSAEDLAQENSGGCCGGGGGGGCGC